MFKSNCAQSDCEKIMYIEAAPISAQKSYKNVWIGTIFTIIVALNLILTALVFTLQRDLRQLQYDIEIIQDILKPQVFEAGPIDIKNFENYVNNEAILDYYDLFEDSYPEHLDRQKRDTQIRDDGVLILDEPYKSAEYFPKTTTVATLKFYNSLKKNIPSRNNTLGVSPAHHNPKHNHNKLDIKSRSKRKLSARMTNRELVEEIEPETRVHKRSGNTPRHKAFMSNAHFYGTSANAIDDCNTVWTLGTWGKGHNDYLQQNDELVIKSAGIYFIYAQLFYYHSKNLSGFSVLRNNNNNLMTCAVSLHTKQSDNRTNSCYVATVAHLNAGDTIKIQDHHTAKCIFQDDKTFFGIFKLSDVKSE